MGTNAKIIFLHHSTGGVIWGGGVATSIANYNSAHSTNYQITARDFPSSNYPQPGGWQNYPYDYWNIWIHGGGGSEPTLETLTAQYDVIVWKHCYPGSDIGPDTGSASVSSSNKTLENYKLQYAALKTKMHSFPNTRFIVWTGAANVQTPQSSAADADRAQEFANWVKNTWDEKGDNIFVWDFRQLETEGVDGGRYLLSKYSAGDSHPNSTLANTIAPYFAQRIVDVIQGHGDTTSITGH
jgi:hypothetical protein